MKLSFKTCYFLLFVTISCAKQVDQTLDDYVTIYKSESAKNPYLSCNVFADQTFRGKIWKNSQTSSHNCFSLDISKSPKELLQNEDLFLQIYPFSIKGDNLNYGSSTRIRTVEKNSEKEKKLLMESKIIDTYLIETQLGLEPDYFFLDHLLEICDVGSGWKGLQLVIYERRVNQDEPALIRITKFLLPPFLTHPGHFREKNGAALAAFHPFLELTADFKSKPSSYYDLAEEMCDFIL